MPKGVEIKTTKDELYLHKTSVPYKTRPYYQRSKPLLLLRNQLNSSYVLSRRQSLAFVRLSEEWWRMLTYHIPRMNLLLQELMALDRL